MANLVYHVFDQSGNPIANAEVSGEWNTAPCGTWDWEWGCTSGSGYSLGPKYTDSSGECSFVISYTASGQSFKTVIKATGYYDQNDGNSTGRITGDIDRDIYMSPTTVQSGGKSTTNTPPPGQGLSAWNPFQGLNETDYILIGSAIGVVILIIVIIVVIKRKK